MKLIKLNKFELNDFEHNNFENNNFRHNNFNHQFGITFISEVIPERGAALH